MIQAVFMMGGLGLVVGIGLALASKLFYVYVDPKVLAVEELLPGANCGGCGYPGCAANAEAIVAGKASPNSCVAAGPEVGEAIAEILGVTIEAKEPDIARPGCTYGIEDADLKYIYNGLNDCRAAALLGGGMKVCAVGCLGLGSCARACPFDAITMGDDHLPIVDEVKCTGCGTCERVCPKNIINLSSVTRRILKEYTTEECTTPCQRACPAGINICEYINEISQGNYRDAVLTIKERNPFPTVIGRICPRPCEDHCRRQLVDEPVAINYLKRFAADYEMKSGERTQPYKAPDTGRKIAVIGGGISGLSAAFFLVRLGHEATVYEATDKLGGLLRSAIAFNRLPREILDWDIQGILELGVKAETGKSLGKDFSVDSLFDVGYEAVLMTTGGWDSRLSRGIVDKVERPIPGTFLLLDWMRHWKDIGVGTDAVIVGGDKLAVDGARLLKDKGAKNITIIYRESEKELSVDDIDPEKLKEEGIQIIFDAAVERLFGEKETLDEIEIVDVKSGEKNKISARTLILASGRFPELIFSRVKPESEGEGEESAIENSDVIEAKNQGPVQWEARESYKRPAYGEESGFFSKADTLTDYSAAVKAIGAGRRVAATIHYLLYDIEPALPEKVIYENSYVQNVDELKDVKLSPRTIMPMCTEPDCPELELGYDENQARREAGRCLRCGLICYRHSAASNKEKQIAVLTGSNGN